MAIIHFATQQTKSSLFSSKRFFYIVLGILLGLSLFYLFRSCSFNHFAETNYSIGQDTRWRGLHLMGKELNLSAFNQQLLKLIAQKENFHVNLTVTSDPILELEQGHLQGVLTALEPSYLNENHLLFSEPYFLTGPVLIIPIAAPTNRWNENRKKIIGIGSHSPKILSFEQDPSIQLKVYDDILSALADLSSQRIDGAIFPAIPAYTYTEAFYKNELKIATLPLTDEGIRLVTLKNAAGELLIKQFNQGLEALKQEGAYDKILKRWGFVNVQQMKP